MMFSGMELYKSDSCVVEHVGERLLLQCGRIMQSNEFRTGLLMALKYAKENQIKQWLLDLREIGQLSDEEETWVQVQLFPQIMMHLGTGNYVAVVVDERCYNGMVSESGLLGLKSYNSFIIINNFCHMHEAIDWLDHRQSKCA
jgi:hypothetical protein